MNDDILYSPDIVDFTIRKGSSYEQDILQHPGLIAYQPISSFIVCYAKLNDFLDMITYMGNDYINCIPNVMGLSDRQSLESGGIVQVQQQPYLSLRGTNVLIGFVDTGIDYTQKVFQKEDGTSKIQYIYDQTIPGNPPDGFLFGTEYTNEQLNMALASGTPYALVPHRDDYGHGTFLASVAAGSPINDFVGAAPDAEIIMVKLKKAYPVYRANYCVPEEQENAFETTAVMTGVEYILQKAVQLNRPAVICLGLGTNADTHDGSGFLEEYLYLISNIPGICMCISVGNESQARHHYSDQFATGETSKNIDVKIGENAGNVLIVITNPISDLLSVSVRSPTGEAVSRLPPRPGYSFSTNLVLERSGVDISYYYPIEGSGDQLTMIRILNATAGIWTITAYGDITIDGRINAWLPITGFVAPNVEFLSSSPYNTITSPSNAPGGIRCGAYNSVRNTLYPPSSWGSTRLALDVPDLVAPGYMVGGYYPTGYGTMSGTSIATAITSGACALMLQWAIVEGNDLSFSTSLIRAFLIRGCNRTDVTNYPNPQWGYGSLNLMQTFFYMRQM